VQITLNEYAIGKLTLFKLLAGSPAENEVLDGNADPTGAIRGCEVDSRDWTCGFARGHWVVGRSGKHPQRVRAQHNNTASNMIINFINFTGQVTRPGSSGPISFLS